MKKLPPSNEVQKQPGKFRNPGFSIALRAVLVALLTIYISESVEGSNTFTETYRSANELQAGTLDVTGRILDEEGFPIPGVTILVKATNNGSISNADGDYRLSNVRQGNVLVFTFIGMKSREIVVSDQTVINVIMEEEAKGLDEVVIVGYGSQQRYSVVGSITTIEPEKLQVSSSRSMSNVLAGQLAGIISVQRSGEPGYDNSNFWIRGISTFGGAQQPLVLIDGIERSLDNIDPAEIESFSILKDASATAVYGVRGANGVILINTKRGQIGQPSINLRYEQGISQPVKLPDFVGAADYLNVLNNIAQDDGRTLPYQQSRIDNIRSGYDPDLYADVNWLDAITQDYASNQRVNMTVSGGSALLRYAIVGSYFGEKGIVARDETQEWDSSMKLQRYNLRTNVDLDLSPTTLLRVNIGGYLQDSNRPPISIDNLFALALETPPHIHPTQYSTGELPREVQRSNPWALATQTGFERNSASKLETLFAVEQDLKAILPGLKANVKFSFDRYSSNGVRRAKEPDYFSPANSRDEYGNLILTLTSTGQNFLGNEQTTEWGNKSIYTEGNLTYNQNFGSHYIDGLFLYNQRHYDEGYPVPFRNQGIAGRAAYSYARKYIAEFNFGLNGSENFAKGQRFGFFPSVAVGWIVTEEMFMKSLSSTISNLKFRASYGLVGNDFLGREYYPNGPIIRFAYLTTIDETDGYRWGINNDYQRAGRWEGNQGVSDVTWETVAKTNLGVELGLWNSINLQVDVFKEQRQDIFMQRRTIPGSSGFISAPWANYGKVDNEGIEVSLDANKQFSSDFSLSVRGSFTYAVNEVIERDEPSSVVGTYRAETGKPVNQLFGLEAVGLFTEDDFSNVATGQLATGVPSHTYGPVRPGDIKYVDQNNDGIINDLDRIAIGGTEDPQMIYGFGANMQFKNIDFGFFFQGNALTNRVIGQGTTYFIPGSGAGALGNFYSNVDDRWTADNPSQDVFWPRLSAEVNQNNAQSSTWWLRDMSMLRLKTVELGYSLKNKSIGGVEMPKVRIFVRGDNLLTISKFDLWDPEVGTNNGFRYPIMKAYAFGASINF